MNDITAHFPGVPESFHRGEDELPFVPFMDGVTMQLLHANVESGLWVIRTKAEPGLTIPRHKHTGPVLAFTLAGSWHYLEYPEVNVAGSYLYEPAGATHTLTVPESNTEITDIWFVINGAYLDLDEDGNVIRVNDAGAAITHYRAECEKLGVSMSDFITA